MVNEWLVAGLSVSVMFNVLVMGFLFVTRIGNEMYQFFKQKLLYKKGGYVNALIFDKDGLVHQVFSKVVKDQNYFLWKGERYVRNPNLLRNYKGIPTYLYIEGSIKPINLFDDKFKHDLGNEEVDKMILAEVDGFDFIRMLKQYAPFILLGLGIFVLLVLASLYFNWQIYDAIVQANNLVSTNSNPINGEVLTER
jgi:hypothetical protein